MYKYLIAIFVFLATEGSSQLEKIGVYGGAYTLNYDSESGLRHSSFVRSYRLGLMTSSYIGGRFSFESGMFIDFSPASRMTPSLKLDDKYPTTLSDYTSTNVGIPLGIMMRTNVTRACVTYIKLSANTLFTVYDKQNVKVHGTTSDPSQFESTFSTSGTKFQYFSSDLDFGFGTFWHIRKLDLQLVLEPKFTIVRYRGERMLDNFPTENLFNSGVGFFGRMGIELTVYRNI